MKELRGIFIPAVTPFLENGEIDFAAMEHNYAVWDKTGISGYMCLGSNGEFRSLDDDESLQVLKKAAVLKKDKILIGGVGRESLHQTLAFIDRVQREKLAIDYLSVITPCYFAKLMDDAALIDYYTRVADFSRYPVLLYCVPAFVNDVCLSVHAVRTLADHSNIYGIKDTSKHMMQEYMAAVGGRDDFTVLSGSLGNLKKSLRMGGSGGILSAANYFPTLCTEITDLFAKGKLEEAEAQIDHMQEIAAATGGKRSVAGVKCTMNQVGLRGGYPRCPVQPVNEEMAQEIRSYIEVHGLL